MSCSVESARIRAAKRHGKGGGGAGESAFSRRALMISDAKRRGLEASVNFEERRRLCGMTLENHLVLDDTERNERRGRMAAIYISAEKNAEHRTS